MQVAAFKSGCHCLKSRCLKKYCICYDNKTSCGAACKCVACQNGIETAASTDKAAPTSVGKKPRSTRNVKAVHASPVLEEDSDEEDAENTNMNDISGLSLTGFQLSPLPKDYAMRSEFDDVGLLHSPTKRSKRSSAWSADAIMYIPKSLVKCGNSRRISIIVCVDYYAP
jgi:hypothetical protein